MLIIRSFKLSGTIDHFRALALITIGSVACNTSNPVDQSAASGPEAAPLPPVDAPLPEEPTTEAPAPDAPAADAPAPDAPSTTDAGGIPIGLFHLAKEDFKGPYNGALHAAGPTDILRNLATIKARGGRVILSLGGSQKYFKDARGHFSLSKWKARVDRFRAVKFSSYIDDGTILGHYLIDEPYDAHNFAGQEVGGATLEEVAKYSKEIWPSLPTIVRAEPYLVQWSGTYRYLDAAWAQYLHRKGDVEDYIAENVRFAKSMGLALVVGLNLHDGGIGNRAMTASQVLSWGSTLLSGSDPCAFISWKYNATYLARPDVHEAMEALSDIARNRPSKACHNG
jgi:hypothetical protein